MRLRWLALLIYLSAPGEARAVDGVSADGTRGYGRLTEAGPEPDIAARVSLGVDVARSDGLVYENDASRITRSLMTVSVSPWRFLELAAQYRALDTYNEYVRPRVLRVRGDGLYSAKFGWRSNAWSAGTLLQTRQYSGAPGFPFSAFGLASYDPLPWRIDLQAGWIGERHVAFAPNPSVVEKFAWQKPSLNALAVRLGAAYNFPVVKPFAILSSETYIGSQAPAARQPKRLTLGTHWSPGIPGTVVTPSADIRLGPSEARGFPAEPPWRAGMLVSYQPPLREIVNSLFPPPGRFTGVVTDVTHGYALPDTRVLINGRQLEVSPEGVFHYESAAGSYFVSLDAPGYLPVTGAVKIEPARVKLEKYGLRRNAGKVRGMVYLGEFKPGKAAVLIANPELNFETDPATGAFSFELPPDAYAMTVTAPGYYPEKRSFVVKLGREVVFDRLVLKAIPVRVVEAPAPVSTPALAAAPPQVAAAVPLPAPPPAMAPEPAASPEPPPTVRKVPRVVEEEEVVVRKKVRTIDEEEEQERQRWTIAQSVPLPDRIESPVFFAFGSWTIDPRAFPALDKLAELLKSDAGVQRIVIEGRADVVGTIEANRFVAGKRADAVFEYLAKRGVGPGRMATTTTVYRRRASGQSDNQRAQDRRVGFRVEREE